jgi:hypothetical protein
MQKSFLRVGHGYAKSGAMPTEVTQPDLPPSDAGAAKAAAKRPLTPEAERALAEAAARRAERDRQAADRPKELKGRDGPDPTRYGDWEINGLAADF